MSDPRQEAERLATQLNLTHDSSDCMPGCVCYRAQQVQALEITLRAKQDRIEALEREAACQDCKKARVQADAAGFRRGVEAAAKKVDWMHVGASTPYLHRGETAAAIRALLLPEPEKEEGAAPKSFAWLADRILGKPPGIPPMHTSACSPECKMPHHVFSSTRRLPLGQVDKSLRYCDSCGLTVEALMHNVSNEENGAAIIAAIEEHAKEEGAAKLPPLHVTKDGKWCQACGAAWPCSGFLAYSAKPKPLYHAPLNDYKGCACGWTSPNEAASWRAHAAHMSRRGERVSEPGGRIPKPEPLPCWFCLKRGCDLHPKPLFSDPCGRCGVARKEHGELWACPAFEEKR